MARWWMVAVALSTGCTAQRYLTLPEPAAVAPAMPEPLVGQTWRVGEVTTRAEMSSSGQWGTAAPNVDVDQLQQQLTERVRSTLVAQKNLGATEGPATYSLEVDLRVREKYGTGKGLALGLGLELGVLGAGAAAGYGITATMNHGQDRAWAPVGMSVGMLAVMPLALIAAFATDMGGVHGEYLATLTLRRRADRVPVATRHLTSTWKADYNGFGPTEKIAKFSGDAVPDFERVLIEGVKSMLLEVNEPLAVAH